MPRVGYAIVGCGWVAPSHAWGAVASEDADLVAVADADLERARALAARFEVEAVYDDYRAVLARDDVDAISVCMPDFLHEEVTLAAAEAGKHVLCEKPLSSTVEGGDRMITACERHGVTLGLVFNQRYREASMRAFAAVRRGAIGRALAGSVVYSCSLRRNTWGPSPWRGRAGQVGGGVLTMQAIHHLDLLLWALGPVAAVQAATANLEHPDEDVEDAGAVVLRLASGAIASVTATNASPTGEDELVRLEIHGTDGHIALESGEVAAWRVRADFEEPELPARPEIPEGARSLLFGPGHVYLVADFVRALVDGTEPPVSPHDGRHLNAVLAAAYESASAGREVTVGDAAGAYARADAPAMLAAARGRR